MHGHPRAVSAGRDAPWDVHGRDSWAGDGVGVEHHEVGLVAGGVVDEADQPATVLAASAVGVGGEAQLARLAVGSELVGDAFPVTRS